jgi:cell division protein FtsB
MTPKRPQQMSSQPKPVLPQPSKRPQTQRQPAQRQPAVSAPETPTGGWLRGIRFSGFSFVMMLILVLAVVILAPSLRTYAEQRQQISQLSAAVADQQDEVDRLTSQRERWNDRTYVTTQARERLSYVLPGDISFLVINDLPVAAPLEAEAAPVSSNIQSTKIDWLGSLFASTMTAGLAPQAAAPESDTPAPVAP